MSPEEIAATFADLTAKAMPINGTPTDDDLTAFRETLIQILLGIPYDEDGAHSLVGLILPTATYTATYPAAFPRPARPAAYDATIADDATPVVRARSEAAHNQRRADYETYAAAERGIKAFLQASVDELWYQDLKDPTSFYNAVTAHDLISHLDDNCGGLHPSELINLPAEMGMYYATSAGIPEYIYALERAQRKLLRGKLPMSDAALLAIASTAVLAAQTYPRVTDDWEARADVDKTWTAWKTVYNAAHLARKRQLLASGGGEPLPLANVATVPPPEGEFDLTNERLDGFLDNLANAATQETTVLAKLTENYSTLTASVAAISTTVAALSAAFTTLSNNNHAAPGTSAAAAPRARGRRNNNRNYAVNGYCWTHGYKVGTSHSSATCTAKAEGHKDAATRANTMGGSVANRGWDAAT